jgi:hypothetical protein
LANLANAPDLSAHAELLHLESNLARDQRRMGELGKTRADCKRARSRVGRTKFEIRMSKLETNLNVQNSKVF